MQQGFPLRTVTAVVVGVLFVIIWTQLATKPKVIIMWGMVEELEGANVLVDGEVVGTLRKFGQNPRTGFEVGKGRHEVRVEHPQFESEPATVNFDGAGESATLMVDVEERYADGGFRPVLVLR